MRFVAALLLCGCLFASGDLPLLTRLLSSGFPSELTPAPAANKAAWVANERGLRNIYVVEGPPYSPRRLTGFTVDDGQEITDLAWTADASAVLYTRGGPANRNGEIPNPASNPNGAEQAVYLLSLSGGPPRKLGTGSQPFSLPKGDRACWTQRNQIWCSPTSGEPKAEQLFRSRGSVSGPVLSPDGTSLAFTSLRGDHSFIGLYDFAKQDLRYLDPSADFDAAPAWSPDSRQLVFRRTPYERSPLPFVARREARLWSLRVVDIATGKAKEIFRASEGPGSVFQPVVAHQTFFWLTTGDIVFPWERTGWKLLYSVKPDGGAARLLTPGEFEVEDVSIAPDGRSLVYNSNQDDIDRRHVWRVAPGSVPQLLTKGKGIEWSPGLLADGKTLACVRSSAREPARISIGGSDVAAPEGFPVDALVEPEAVHFPATDGMMIPAQLFRPANLKPGERRPAIVHFHGGSRRQMLLGWNYRPYYHNAYAVNQFLASRGYVVLTVNYRSGIGYGMEFREALDYGANGASEYQDVVGAGLYLRNRADVDGRRIGLWGGSYGGFLTAMGLARASSLFAAGVDIHGVHDWNHGIQNFAPDYDPAAPDRAAAARRAWESSPLAYVSGWRSPVLLIHGDDDRNVNFNETVRLAAELRQRNVEFEQLIFPDEVHDFLLHANWLRAMQATVDFFDRKLGKQ